MVVHIVSFKYKPDTSAAARQDHQAQLSALAHANIDGVLDLKVGPDFIRSPRSFDAGLVVSFRDRAALDVLRDASAPRARCEARTRPQRDDCCRGF